MRFLTFFKGKLLRLHKSALHIEWLAFIHQFNHLDFNIWNSVEMMCHQTILNLLQLVELLEEEEVDNIVVVAEHHYQ